MAEFFTLCTVFIKVIPLIYEKNYFDDRVPLNMSGKLQVKAKQAVNAAITIHIKLYLSN